MSTRLRVGLLFGGASVEHEVSVVSARGVARGLDPERYEVLPIGVTEDGAWLPPAASGEILASTEARVGKTAGPVLLVDPAGGLLTSAAAGLERLGLDVVFSVVHGWGGEDGRFQGLLDVASIPYVGAGVLGSAMGMDKEIAKTVFERRGLPVGPWRALRRHEHARDRDGREGELVRDLGLPLFVKPANGGSSVGITKVSAAHGLRAALEEAFAHDGKAVVEAGIDVREIEVAVLGNEEPEASVPGEILPSGEFYDYASKYLDGSSQLRIPADLPGPTAEELRRTAIEAFRALELSGLARVDFFLDRKTGDLTLNEVNTLPGFTPISMYPKLWEASGLPYPSLLDRLIELARERAATMQARVRRRSG